VFPLFILLIFKYFIMENVLSYLVFRGSNGLKFVLLDGSVEMKIWFEYYIGMLDEWGLWWDVMEV